jgi:hypothetical protein
VIINQNGREGVAMRSKSFLAVIFVAALALPAVAQNPADAGTHPWHGRQA